MGRYSREFYESDWFRGLYAQLSGRYSWLTEDMFRSLYDQGIFGGSDSVMFGALAFNPLEQLDSTWFDWYGNYLSKIAQYKGTEYYEQLLNNPYASYQGGLSQTDWNERFNNADAEFYKIIGTAQQNNYNSTVAASARDKQAGFNDALSGQLAGNQAAANNAPSENRPAAGPSDDAVLQADIQERQNKFDRAIRIASLPLDMISSVSSGMSAFAGLMKVGAEIDGLTAGAKAATAAAGASDAAADLSKEQAAGQKAQNQNTWRGQFLDTIMGGVDLANGSVNIADRIKSVDKSVMTPEQAEYFDSLVNSGYFADADGNASAAAMQDYSARLAGTSGNLFDAGISVGRLGGIKGLADPISAMSYIMDIFGQTELETLRLDLDSKRLSNELTSAQADLVSLQQLKTAQETSNLEQEGINLVTEGEKLSTEADIAELDKRIRSRVEYIQGLQSDIMKNDLRRDKLRSESYNRILDYAEKSDNFFVKQGASQLIRTLDEANKSQQEKMDRGLDNLGKVMNMIPSTPAK